MGSLPLGTQAGASPPESFHRHSGNLTQSCSLSMPSQTLQSIGTQTGSPACGCIHRHLRSCSQARWVLRSLQAVSAAEIPVGTMARVAEAKAASRVRVKGRLLIGLRIRKPCQSCSHRAALMIVNRQRRSAWRTRSQGPTSACAAKGHFHRAALSTDIPHLAGFS